MISQEVDHRIDEFKRTRPFRRKTTTCNNNSSIYINRIVMIRTNNGNSTIISTKLITCSSHTTPLV